MEDKNELNEEYRESLRKTIRDFFVILDWSFKNERDRFNYIIKPDGITVGYFKDYETNKLNLESFKKMKDQKLKEKVVEFDNENVNSPVDIGDEFIRKLGLPIVDHFKNCFMSISMAKLENDDIKKFMAKNKPVFKIDELIQEFMNKSKEALNLYVFMNNNIHVFMYSTNIISNEGYIPNFNRDFIYSNMAFIITDKKHIPVNIGHVEKVFKKEELPLFLIDL